MSPPAAPPPPPPPASVLRPTRSLPPPLPEIEDGERGDLTHARLVVMAERWLRREQRCGIVFRDTFRVALENREQPDAIGWRFTTSILIECKVTRSDFLADRRKPFRLQPEKGVGDWRFYLCPDGLIQREELPEGWGLLYAKDRRIVPAAGTVIFRRHRKAPFAGRKDLELHMMYSALRRMVLRGHFESIYSPIPERVVRL